MSIYSLLTGNYGNYRSRQKLSSADAANSIPAMLSEKGYGTYFLYSGPTYFEGLHDMLAGFGLTIINKEKLEKFRDPATGRPYRSFNWGVDDASLVQASSDLLSRNSGPGLYFIGLSSTHSPYFNPDPSRFNRFDNSTAEGRYRNSIDYEVRVIDMLIEKFLHHNSDTLFVILSDHGESFGQEGYSKHSFSLYNTEIGVPFIMLHSSFGRRIAPFIGSIIDVYPTLADMMGAGIKSPVDGRSVFMRGYSLKLFLSSWRDGDSKGLVYGSRKWIYSRRDGTLYEMNPDDSERIDLTADPGKGAFVRFLGRQY
jgi:phosphoglycerol transferase MdoB-like AlkP superfamily enzyme